jgi:hypothetical protein
MESPGDFVSCFAVARRPSCTTDLYPNGYPHVDTTKPGHRAHSVISQAGAAVLTRFYGPTTRLTVTSEVLPGVTRAFSRFQDIADEAGTSRIYVGVHTRLDHNAGLRLGREVARFTLAYTTGSPAQPAA